MTDLHVYMAMVSKIKQDFEKKSDDYFVKVTVISNRRDIVATFDKTTEELISIHPGN